MYRLFFFILFLFFLTVSPPIFASEAENIVLGFEEEKKLTIEDVSKFILSDPNIIDVKISKNNVILKGLKYGETNLYLLQNGKLSTYLVSVRFFKKEQRYTIGTYSRQNLYQLVNPNASYGVYTLSSLINLNPSSNLNSQSFSNNINYKIFLDEHNFDIFNNKFILPKSEINLNGSNVTQFSNFRTLNNLSFQNLGANFNNRLFNINLGDFSPSTSNSSSLVPSVSSQLRGLNFLLKNESYQYNIFSGFEIQPVSIYNGSLSNFTEVTNKDSVFVNGLSSFSRINDYLSLFGAYLSKKNFTNDVLSTDDLVISSLINLPESLLKNSSSQIQTSIATNFYSLSFQANPTYTYKWSDINQSLGIGGSFLYIPQDYSYIGAPSKTSISINSGFAHSSNLTLGSSVNLNMSDSNIDRKNIVVSLSKSFFDNNFSISDNYLDVNNYNKNTITIEGNIKTFNIPFSINYQYTNNVSNILPLLNSVTNTFKFDLKQLNFDPFYSNLTSQIMYNHTGFGNGLNWNIASSISYNPTFFSKINFTGSYNFNISDLDKWVRNDLFLLNLQSSFDVAPYHKFYINMGISNNLFIPVANKFTFSTNAGYTLEFGREYEKVYKNGDIKGVIYEDDNDNAVFDKGEKIVKSIKVFVDDNNSSIANENGYTIKDLYQKNDYSVYVDSKTLPRGYQVTTEYPMMVTLDSNVKEVNFGIRKQVIIKGYIYGSKLKRTLLSGIKVVLDNKESVTTDEGGDFEFKAEPGEHTISVIPTTIPINYSLLGEKIKKKVNLENGETEMDFVFLPVTVLKVNVYMIDLQKKTTVFAKNSEVTYSYMKKDDNA